ncbi:MAG: HTTM domain-containing protein [Anaerolineae bacterium]|nr:HTTM domain-containing protein [Anaerolineae bacterium]
MQQSTNGWQILFRPTWIHSLVVVRIAFGAVMVWEVTRYFRYGWIARYWIEPAYNFSYPLFGWLKPWPGDGMYWHFYLLAVLALFIALGLFYRLNVALFFLAFSYTFLLEEARYLNHFYLVSIFSFILIFVPAHRWLSLDALIWPRIRSSTVPTWTLWLVGAQIGIPYFFGGVAKLNGDWLRGAPMDLPVAWQPHQLPCDRPLLYRRVGRLLLLLWRPPARSADRTCAAVAQDARPRLHHYRALPPAQRQTVRHRHLPLDDDHPDHHLLPARLAEAAAARPQGEATLADNHSRPGRSLWRLGLAVVQRWSRAHPPSIRRPGRRAHPLAVARTAGSG